MILAALLILKANTSPTYASEIERVMRKVLSNGEGPDFNTMVDTASQLSELIFEENIDERLSVFLITSAIEGRKSVTLITCSENGAHITKRVDHPGLKYLKDWSVMDIPSDDSGMPRLTEVRSVRIHP